MIEIDTRKPVEVIDITSSIERALQQSKIEDGICLVYTLHTTTGLAINESDPDLVQDILSLLASLVPQGKAIFTTDQMAMPMLTYAPCFSETAL